MKRTLYLVPGLLDGGTEVSTDGAIQIRKIPALVMVEGEHTDSSGKTTNYTVERMSAIVEASNNYLQAGNRIPLLADHEYSQFSQIGTVTGPFTLQEITEANLPHPGMTDLLGKQGIYTYCQIAGQENIAQYEDGRLKTLSVGVDISGNYFGKNVIYEISAVPFPAVRGASLFSKGWAKAVKRLPKPSRTAAMRSLRFALSLGEQLAENAQERMEDKIYELWWAFTDVLDSIRSASPEELAGRDPQALKAQAIEDFYNSLKSYLGITATNPQPLTTVPLFGANMDPKKKNENTAAPATDNQDQPEQQTHSAADVQKMAAQLEQLQADNQAARDEVEQFKRRSTITARYSKLRRRGEELRSAGKMTPADFNDKFGTDIDEAIECYCNPPENEAHKYSLDALGYYLDNLEQYATPVKFGSHLGAESLPPAPGQEAATEHDEELEKYISGGKQ